MAKTDDSKKAPQASIIIPHYNDKARLALCLTALFEQDLARAEVIVADNGTPGGIEDVLIAFPQAKAVTQPEKGAASARNKGVESAKGEMLLFLDADCVPAPDWIETALKVGRPGVVVGGRIDVFDETPPPRSGPEAFEAVFSFDQRRYVEDEDFSVTANLVTMRQDFLRIGWFVVGRSEDVDWCHRAVADGMRIAYDDHLLVRHPSRSDWPALKVKWRRLTQEMFALRTPDSLATRMIWMLRGMAMPLSAILHMPRVINSPKLSSTGEKVRGILTLIRLRCLRGSWMVTQALGGSI